jgi:bifunctional DNA-binding transcriptional regulator/antitoxin component of YhaV-PrlF toxin-antitoxin module
MPHLKLTAKRQATLPAATCDALGVEPGDLIALESRVENGERLWVLRPAPRRARPWVGCLAGHARPVRSHAMQAIRRSIAAARKKARVE